MENIFDFLSVILFAMAIALWENYDIELKKKINFFQINSIKFEQKSYCKRVYLFFCGIFCCFWFFNQFMVVFAKQFIQHLLRYLLLFLSLANLRLSKGEFNHIFWVLFERFHVRKLIGIFVEIEYFIFYIGFVVSFPLYVYKLILICFIK